MEKNMVAPAPFSNVLFSDSYLNSVDHLFCPTIAHTLSIWYKYEKLHNWDTNWQSQTPLFHNPLLQKEGSSFVAHQ